MISYDDIQKILSSHPHEAVATDSLTRAAVALILRASPSGMEVLFVERATRPGDPWSGDLGFPGGKVEPFDGNEQLAAERETLEEIGLNLEASRFLGRLTDIVGAHVPVRVSCFVYGMLASVSLRLDDEIKTAFWVPLQGLCDPRRHLQASVRFGGSTLIRPAIRILEPGRTVLWGITYRLVMQFLQIAGSPVSAPPSVEDTQTSMGHRSTA